MHCFRLNVGMVAWIALGLVAGCEKEEVVRTYPAPKEPQVVTWTVPDGWRTVSFQQVNPQLPGLLQYGSFAAGGEDAPVQISVITLFPDAPGSSDLLLNVNRWRRQLELPAADPGELSRLVMANSFSGTTAQWVDMTGRERRMRAAILPREDRIWFFKMTGPPEVVESQKENFDAFVKSSRFLTPAAEPLTVAAGASPASETAHPVAPAGVAAATPTRESGGLSYTLPQGWSVQPNANRMRVLTLRTGGTDPAELIVTPLSSSFGGMAMNINRWRGEVGLPPVADASGVPETSIQVGSAQGTLMDFSGPGKEASKPMRSLIARRTQGDSVWFFKILGPAETVTQQRAAFEEFLASVKLPGEAK